MHRPSNDKRAKRRERDRRRKAAQRQRERDGVVTYPGKCSGNVVAAIKARNIFAGMPKDEAEKQASDPKKLAAEIDGILEEWSRHWYSASK